MTLPEGTVTFLRTDIEGSMDLARALGARYDELNAGHHALVRSAIEWHGGQVPPAATTITRPGPQTEARSRSSGSRPLTAMARPAC